MDFPFVKLWLELQQMINILWNGCDFFLTVIIDEVLLLMKN